MNPSNNGTPSYPNHANMPPKQPIIITPLGMTQTSP